MKIVSLIKYEGDNTTFVWKHPNTDFNTMSQLVVHETQEAIFFNNGQALDTFGPGRYTLETQNIPLLRHVLNIPTGGKTPFHCEVYFVNKTQQMAIKWGCDSQIQYLDPTYKFPLQVGLSGEMTLCVSDARKLLVKIVGTEKSLTQTDLVKKFRALLNSKIKPYVAKVMQSGAYSIFEIDSHMDEFSEDLQNMLVNDFAEYGLKLVHFYVTNLVKPEDDPTYQRFKSLHINQYLDVAEAKLRQQVTVIDSQTKAQQTIIESEGLATKRAQEGYTYGQERGLDVAEKVAENEAVGEFSNLGIGLGMMTGVGVSVGSQVGGFVGNAVNNVSNSVVPQANESSTNNAPVSNPESSGDDMAAFENKLKKLRMMKDSGLLTDDEFNAQKMKLLEDL